MIIVLSENSLQSAWVKKELNAGLIREIDDKKLTILPIVIDDSEIPLFLREKLYADFRGDFEGGLKKILRVVTKKYNLDGGGRVSDDTTYYFDYTIEHSFLGKHFFMEIDVVSFDTEEEFSILTQFQFYSSEYAEDITLDKALADDIKVVLLGTCAEEFLASSARIVVNSGKPIQGSFTIDDKEKNSRFDISYKSKRLGLVSGGAVVFNIGALFIQICDDVGIIYQTEDE